MEQARIAEKAMKDAQEALKAYTENQSATPDRSLHRYLTEALRVATEDYFKALLELHSK
jgi:hypothetical protein